MVGLLQLSQCAIDGQVSNAMSVRHRTSCLSAVCVYVYMCVRVCKSPHL